MKKLFVFLTLLVFLVVSCASGQLKQTPCPARASIMMGNTTIGQIPFKIPQGHLDHHDNFWTEEEFNKKFYPPKPAPEQKSMKPDLTL